MNGNKRNIIIVIALLLTLQACFLFKKSTKPDKPEKEKEPTDTTQVMTDTVLGTDTIPIPIPSVRDLKAYYKVAVLLPFYLDNRYLLDLDPDAREYDFRQMITTEYLQGMLIALSHLENDSVKLEVTFHDTRNDSNSVRGLMRLPEMKEMDLIIGPLFPDKLAMMEDFARENEIMMVSPLSTKILFEDTNSYYLNAIPSLEAHCEEMAQYTSIRFRNYPTFILHTSDSSEVKLAKFIARTYTAATPFLSEARPIKTVELGLNGKMDSTLLVRNDTNIVIIPSINEIFVTNVLRELNNQTVGKALNLSMEQNQNVEYRVKPEQIFVFGMPKWISDFSSLRFDYLNRLNYFTTEEFLYDTTSKGYKRFADDFIDTFQYAPSLTSMRAYDMTYYLGQMLHLYGTSFRDYFPFYHKAPINRFIDIQPVYIYGKDPEEEILHHYENRFVHILRYKDYNLELAPTFFSK